MFVNEPSSDQHGRRYAFADRLDDLPRVVLGEGFRVMPKALLETRPRSSRVWRWRRIIERQTFSRARKRRVRVVAIGTQADNLNNITVDPLRYERQCLLHCLPIFSDAE